MESKSNMEFYNRNGNATCFSRDDAHIHLWNGRPAGFNRDEKVYSYSGKLIGWFRKGWLYDRRNRPALFMRDSEGGPAKPARKAKPAKGARGARPAKGARQATPAKPARSVTWSAFSGENYFEQ